MLRPAIGIPPAVAPVVSNVTESGVNQVTFDLTSTVSGAGYYVEITSVSGGNPLTQSFTYGPGNHTKTELQSIDALASYTVRAWHTLNGKRGPSGVGSS